MAYTYTEMFIRSPVERSSAPARERQMAPGTAARAHQAERAVGEPARNTQDTLRKHLSEKAADGWKIEKYAVTAREDGFTHHIVWYKADH